MKPFGTDIVPDTFFYFQVLQVVTSYLVSNVIVVLFLI